MPAEEALADTPAEQAPAGAAPEEALAGTPVEQAPVEPLLDSAASAADRLNALLARLQADPQLAPAAEYLRRLSDEAQAEAHARGIRALAQTLPHAFGQPLSEILGYAELLRAGQYSAAEQGEMLGQIERASARLGQTMRAVARLADSHLGQPRWRVSGGRELVELELPAVEPRPGEPTALAELRQSALRQVADTQSGPTSEP